MKADESRDGCMQATQSALPRLPDERGVTPLMTACNYDSEKLLRLLISEKADVELASTTSKYGIGHRPLHLASLA